MRRNRHGNFSSKREGPIARTGPRNPSRNLILGRGFSERLSLRDRRTPSENSELSFNQRFRLYRRLESELNIVAASIRYDLSLLEKVELVVEPADDSQEAGAAADLFRHLIFNTRKRMTMPELMRTMGRARYDGASVVNWWPTPVDAPQGQAIGFDMVPVDLETIVDWRLDEYNEITTAFQRPPTKREAGQTGIAPNNRPERSPEDYNRYIAIPRNRLLYVKNTTKVEDAWGRGIFHRIGASGLDLIRLQRAAIIGFKNNFIGTMIVRAPFTRYQEGLNELRNARADGVQPPDGGVYFNTQEQKDDAVREWQEHWDEAIKQLEELCDTAVATEDMTRLFLDSETHTATDHSAEGNATTKISTVYQYDAQTLGGTTRGFNELRDYIIWLNRSIARVMGTEQLLLGDNSTGSYALAEQKTSQFNSIVNAQARHQLAAFNSDIIDVLCGPEWNDIPERIRPRLRHETVAEDDIASMLAYNAQLSADGMNDPEHPIHRRIRSSLGIPSPARDVAARIAVQREEARQAVLNPPQAGGPDNE